MKNQQGFSLISVIVGIAIIGVGSVVLFQSLGNSRNFLRAQEASGDLYDMRMAIARQVNCSATVTANRAACDAGGFVQLGTKACEAFHPSRSGQPAFKSARTDEAAHSYDLRATCRKSGTDTYDLTFEYLSLSQTTYIPRGWTQLMLAAKMTCVVPQPPADIRITGWQARNRVIDMKLAGLTRLNPMGDDNRYGQSGAYLVNAANLGQACLAAFEYDNKLNNLAPCNGPAHVLRLPPGDNYSSCGDNTTGIWDPHLDNNQGNFKIVNSCPYNGRLWMGDYATCRCDAQPPVTCAGLR